MTLGMKIWRATVGRFQHAMGASIEKRYLRKSFVRPIIKGGRDSLKYHENGRWTTVEAEMMSRSAEVDKMVYRDCPMRWSDTGENLTETERQKVFEVAAEYFARKNIRWKFYDATW
jgi:hypothetical protein